MSQDDNARANIEMEERFYRDDFEVLLLRDGWTLIGCKPLYTDPEVLAIRKARHPLSVERGPQAWHALLGDTTFRKLLRAILNRPRSTEQLLRICGDARRLDGYLAWLEQGDLVVREDDQWTRGPGCGTIDNIGPTLEWYVAEWYRSRLSAPARHGVKLKEVLRGGDLDIVAFMGDIKVMVECKTSKPTAVSETELRWFLQRAHEFDPEIALLLIDTDSDISVVVERLNGILGGTEPAIKPDLEAKDLYWGVRNIFVTNVRKDIETSLLAAHRLYSTHVRHMLILWSEERVIRDYVSGHHEHSDGAPDGGGGTDAGTSANVEGEPS